MELRGRALLRWALDAVDDTAAARESALDVVVVVAPPAWCDQAARLFTAAEAARTQIVPGGLTRTDSVAAGLAVLPKTVRYVLVHDAARALAPPALFDAVLAALHAGDAAVVPGLPLSDTIKQVDADGLVVATPARERLRAVQTPQGFDVDVLRRAHADGAGAAVTDDAGLVERLGVPVRVVAGDAAAAKVTTRDDVRRAEHLLAARAGEARA